MTWLDDYKARLDGIVASKQKAVKITGSPQMSNAYALLASVKNSPGVYSGPNGASAVSDNKGGVWNATKSGGLKLLDYLARPLHGFENAMDMPSYREKSDKEIKDLIESHGQNKQEDIGFFEMIGLAAKDFGEGFTGKEEISGSELLRNTRVAQGTAASIGGFGVDVVLDPLNFVGAGAFRAAAKGAKATKNIGKAKTAVGKEAAEISIETPQVRAATELETLGSTNVEKQTGNDLLEFMMRQRELSDTKGQLAKIADVDDSMFRRPDVAKNVDVPVLPDKSVSAVPSPRPPAVESVFDFEKAAKVDPLETELITHRAALEAATNKLSGIPTRRYSPSTKISPAFVEEAPTPAASTKAATTTAAKPVGKSKGIDSARARALAMKQHVLSTPNYQISVKIGGRDTKTSVANLRAMAERDPSKAKMIDTMINAEARRLAKEGPEYFSDSPVINLTGRSGSGRAAMSVDDFQRLLETGQVPKPGKGKTQAEAREFFDKDKDLLRGESPLDAFGLHSTDDLANLHLSDIAGGREPIGAYLKRQGVKISNVDPVAERGANTALEGTSRAGNPGSGVGDATRDPEAQAGSGTPSRARYRSMKWDERAAWVAAHKDQLDPTDIATLLKTKITATDTSAWDKAVESILNRVNPTDYVNIDDLMKALDEGRVNAADIQDLQKITGAKTPKGIKSGLQKLMKRVTELEAKTSARRLESVDINQWETPLPATKPAEEIVEEVVEKGDTSALADVKPTLDAKQVQDLQAVMGHLVQREIIDPQTAEKYGFVSRTGTKRTASTMNKGLGRNLDEWNKYSQLSMVSGVIKFRTTEVMNAIKASGIKGSQSVAARQAAMYDHVLPVMQTVDRLLKENGIPPLLSKNPRYSASLIDVLGSMPRPFVEKHFFSMVRDAEHIPPTFWNDAAEVVQDYAHGRLDFETAIHGVRDVLMEKVKTRNGKTIFTGVRSQYYKIRGAVNDTAAEDYVLGIAREFMQTAGSLKQIIEKNIAEVVVHDTNGAAKVSQQALKTITDLVSSPGFSTHDLLRVANDRDAIVESVARTAGVSSDRAKAIAKSDIEVQTATLIPPEVAANAHHAKQVAQANVPAGWGRDEIDRGWAKTSQTGKPHEIKMTVHKTPKGREVVETGKKKVVLAIGKSLDDTEVAVKQVMDTAGESLTDIGVNAERVMGWGVLKAFAPHLGNADVRPLFLTRNSFAQTVGRSYSALLSNISKTHAGADIDAAWKEIQNGTRAGVESVSAAQADLEKAVRSIFPEDETYNLFRTAGITPEQVNGHFKKFGIHDKYRLTEDYMNDWKRWETDNPLDLLSRVQAAVMASRTERVLGADLSRRFGSANPSPGSVRITSTNSILGRYLDPTAHFPREIAEQMSVLDAAMKQMAQPANSNKALAMYDNVLHAYKSGLTIYRPGHHIRNMVGDTWLSWMDGVNDPRVYRRALEVMRDNRGRYDDFDALQALSAGGQANAKKNSIVARTVVGGKKVELTTGQIYQLAYKNGILPDYRTLEDIQFGDSANVFDSLGRIGKPFNGKLHGAASSLSESRDHYVRIAHFIDRMNKSSGSNLDEIAESAANRVRKWHPDGSDLTNFESKVARRTFLFYSWLRKAVPLIVESTVMKPGKVMVYPKAMYAIAEANGVDPNSLGDPFPTDELFPSWIRDSTEGPAFERDGRFFSVSPGIPFNDVVNDYGVGPKETLRSILGSTTPLLKIPVEVAMGDEGDVARDSRTGAPKTDTSDYIDQQIPGVNVVANLTNRSPSSLFTQNTGESTGMGPEEIARANEKNTPGPDTLALINWLTGAGLMDLSKPNYKRQAQIEAGRSGR